MCTYNRERYLKRAIDSVLRQTYGEFEFIIVDDGSTDSSEQLIKAYQDDRIKYYRLKRNSFYCYAANYGLQFCQGEYIAFMNSDDVWHTEKLEKQLCFMETHKEYGACFTAVTLIDDEEHDVTDECSEMRDRFQKQYSSQKECIQFLLQKYNTLCHPSALVRKEVMDQVGGFNLMYCQLADYDLWIRIVSECPIYVLEERLIQFRWDMKKKDQISVATKENSVRAFNEQILIKKHLVDRLSDEKFKEFFAEEFRNKNSASHLELEFERAFLLAECVSEDRELKVLGIEKLEQVMRMPGAMETLREHFGMDIFELYGWNKAYMYKNPWLMADFQELERRNNCQEMELEKLQQQILLQKEQIDSQREQIDRQKDQIFHQTKQISQQKECMEQQKQLIDTYANSTSWKVTEPFRRFTRLFRQ